jgi:hypothetical protein
MVNFGTRTVPVTYLWEKLLPDFYRLFFNVPDPDPPHGSALIWLSYIQILNVNTDLDPNAIVQEKLPFFH